MTQVHANLKRTGRGFRYAGAALMSLTGLAYIIFPPKSAESLWSGSWPAIVWGALMVAAGVVVLAGMRSRILQVEQYGQLMVVVSSGMLVINQVLLMVHPEVTPTRLGGTLVLAAFVGFATARYFELGADTRSARLAEAMTGD